MKRGPLAGFVALCTGFGILGATMQAVIAFGSTTGFDFIMLTAALGLLYWGGKELFYGR